MLFKKVESEQLINLHVVVNNGRVLWRHKKAEKHFLVFNKWCYLIMHIDISENFFYSPAINWALFFRSGFILFHHWGAYPESFFGAPVTLREIFANWVPLAGNNTILYDVKTFVYYLKISSKDRQLIIRVVESAFLQIK